MHKSYYSDIDVDILNRYRTVAPAGKLHYFYCSNELHIEIDQNKAYTHNLTNILKIPVFKELDIWMPLIMVNMILITWESCVYS